MARFPSIDSEGAFEAPEVQNKVKELVTGSTDGITVDTSVGTRVFVGDTMIYGDTGWRDISGFLHEEWVVERNFRIKRENNMVHLMASIKRTESSPTRPLNLNVDLLSTENSRLWGGFRPLPEFSDSYAFAAIFNGEPLALSNVGHRDNLRLRTRQAASSLEFKPGDYVWFTTSWATQDTWPTSLPGTPA